eukprot:CAMPEP_0172895194 /NCGR_PEP_ID=MMETSP1075-20121228/152523_1 /TAXON_ID=2916 /ORGANISM="Ceratium fusus, Strain PA161109" /LENGTH=552 /DNA_ID=CAMNT_0013750369 /DNA_START=264 /DNA_END=1920 /DNA_ORIENTATION=-
MRGEWFDSASCLATFSTTMLKEKPEQVKVFRHTLMRLMSLCHGSALDEIRCEETESYEVLDHHGLDAKTLTILRDCKIHGFNRVEIILHMVQVLVINACKDKILDVPPPILSRVYQTLSRGFVHLLSAKKVRDTRFPFPYAQLIAVMLWGLAIITPVAMSSLVPHEGWCAICTFVPIFGTFALNMIAEELEMPYGEDANDLPLDHFQREMNSSLLMLSHDLSDHIASVGPRARMGYNDLIHSLKSVRGDTGPDYTRNRSGGGSAESLAEHPMTMALSVRATTSRQKKGKKRNSLYAGDHEGEVQKLTCSPLDLAAMVEKDDAIQHLATAGSVILDCDNLAVVQEENSTQKSVNSSDLHTDKQENELNRWRSAREPASIQSVSATTTGESSASVIQNGIPPVAPSTRQIIVEQLTSLAEPLTSLAPGSSRSHSARSSNGRPSSGRPSSGRRNDSSTPQPALAPIGTAGVHGEDVTSPQVAVAGTINATKPASAARRSAWRQASRPPDEAAATSNKPLVERASLMMTPLLHQGLPKAVDVGISAVIAADISAGI